MVGAGQAGLAVSHLLAERGIEHVMLERARAGHRWRSERWDSLRFQFPNWCLELPGWHYEGSDPDGFAHHDEIADVIESYGRHLREYLREGTPVTEVRREGQEWSVATPTGGITCRSVVLATGPFQEPVISPLAAGVPEGISQLHSRDYRNPSALPAGAVLVVGGGGSGTQIAEELCEAGRVVHLAASTHRWVPRRYRGRDATWWLLGTGALDRPLSELPEHRPPPSLLVTGVGGGHDMNLRRLHAAGVRVHGSLREIEGGVAVFQDNAEAIASAADEACAQFLAAADAHAERLNLDLPAAQPRRFAEALPARTSLDLHAAGVSSVIWCTGYRLAYAWVKAPFLDERGVPRQERGITPCEGLYVLGLHWMHTVQSGLFFGVERDAAHLVDHIARRMLSGPPRPH